MNQEPAQQTDPFLEALQVDLGRTRSQAIWWELQAKQLQKAYDEMLQEIVALRSQVQQVTDVSP